MPSVALVIGTYASVPYVHLQLAALSRFEPEIPILIHDDGSPAFRELNHLATQYGCELISSSLRCPQNPPGLGDLASFVQGLLWAKRNGAGLLVKFSRRWVVSRPWSIQLQHLAHRTRAATFSSYCLAYGFGFRTECVALDVERWYASGFLEDARGRIERAELPLPEFYLHQWAQEIARDASEYNKRVQALTPVDLPFGGCLRGYSQWREMMGESRSARRDRQLWHDTATPDDYAIEAERLGLKLSAADFILS